MSDEKKGTVVIDETGENIREKTKEEVEVENKKLEESLQPEKKDEGLDPDVLKKLKSKSKKKEATAQPVRDRSLYWGVIGVGQAGSRIAEIFYKLGYESCVFNTASQDLEFIEMPENRKVLLNLALGGAGKELSNGALAVENNADIVMDKLNDFFTDDQEMLLVVASGAGGTGSGGIENMIHLASSLGKPIGVIYVLPLESEDALGKHNAITTLSKLSKLASSDVISSLVVVDNAKIDLIYSGLSKADFWDVANSSIVEPLHLFNHLSSLPTKYDALDAMDFARGFTAGDCTIFGMIEVEDYLETTAIAEAVVENLEHSLLASDFDLTETRFCEYIVTGSPEALRKLPAANIHYATHMLSEQCDNPQMIHGVYEMEDMDTDCIRVYTLLSGLGLPRTRINSLQKDAEKKMSAIRDKERKRASNMNIDYGTGTETQDKAQEVHRLIKQKKSGFGQIASNAGKRILDKRKR